MRYFPSKRTRLTVPFSPSLIVKTAREVPCASSTSRRILDADIVVTKAPVEIDDLLARFGQRVFAHRRIHLDFNFAAHALRGETMRAVDLNLSDDRSAFARPR